MKQILLASAKGLYWSSLIVLFGLCQLWIATVFHLYDNSAAVTLYNSTKDGVLLFFALAVVMSVTMDYWFDERLPLRHNLAKTTAFVFFPIVVMGFVISAYAMISFNNASGKEAIVNTINISALVLSFLFAFIGKSYLFIASQKP